MRGYTEGYIEGYDTALTDNAAELARLREENARLVDLLQDIAAYYPNSWAADRCNAALEKGTDHE